MGRLQIILTCLTLFSLTALGQERQCKRPDYGKWDIDFKDGEIDDYTIWFKLDTFTQYLKGGQENHGELQGDKNDCFWTLTFEKVQGDTTATEVWIIFEDLKEKKAKFRMTPKGNLHVTLGEGKMTKQKSNIVLY